MAKAWIVMMISGLVALLFGDTSLALTSMLKGANASVQLALNLVAMYGFWLGFFGVLEKLRITELIAKLLSPLIKFLFKGADETARKYIAVNMAANLIGLGNAATPMGMSAIASLEDGTARANTNVIMLVVISATSLQLLPTTVISMRASHGSANAGDFLLPSIIATTISTVVGIILVKICSKISPDKKRAKYGAKELSVEIPLSGAIKSPK